MAICGDQRNKRIIPTMNHRKDGSIEFTLDIVNMDNIFESLPITKQQYNGMIELGFEYEEKQRINRLLKNMIDKLKDGGMSWNEAYKVIDHIIPIAGGIK